MIVFLSIFTQQFTIHKHQNKFPWIDGLISVRVCQPKMTFIRDDDWPYVSGLSLSPPLNDLWAVMSVSAVVSTTVVHIHNHTYMSSYYKCSFRFSYLLFFRVFITVGKFVLVLVFIFLVWIFRFVVNLFVSRGTVDCMNIKLHDVKLYSVNHL